MTHNRVITVVSLVLIIFLGIEFWNTIRNSNQQSVPYYSERRHGKDEPMTDAIGAADYEFNLLKNPESGMIPEGIRDAELSQAYEILTNGSGRISANAYTYQGPDNLGGRTRSLVYDARYNGTNNQTIFAGGVSGGLFKSINNGASWNRTTPPTDIYNVTSIVQDKRPGFQDTWYYSTGEAIGNSASGVGASYLGRGIYKSTNNGETWTRLTGSIGGSFELFDDRRDYTFRIAVNPINGDIYLAAVAGIYRSVDGGNTWSLVISGTLSNSGQSTDVAITSGGRIYVAFGGTNSATVDGVWTSTVGSAGSWVQLAGAGAGGSPAGWKSSYRRIVLHVHELPTDTLLFALYDNGLSSNCTTPVKEADFFRWNQVSGIWTDLSANLPDEPGCSTGNDPFATQGGYDLVVRTKPDDPNVIFVGGTNLYRSIDGFSTNGNTTRIGGYATPNSYSIYSGSHPDIHDITFEPVNPSVMVCSNDGGIQRTDNVMAATVSWTNLSNDYRTFQYYYVAQDPRQGNGKVLGGAQDNGTTTNLGGTGATFQPVWGGDGVSVGLSYLVSGSTYEYCGSQFGSIYRRNASSAAYVGTNIRPSSATSSGLFVTLFKLDNDNTEYLYYASAAQLYRNTAASAATPFNWSVLIGVESAVTSAGATYITALATTRGSYTSSASSLFVGTNSGDLFRLDDPVNAPALATPVNITGAGFPASGYVSSISVNPRNDDTVLVTFSNYGITSVFWTGNANAATPTWHNVEGNLTLASFRASAIVVTGGRVQYFVGTSTGLYSTVIDATNPGGTVWTTEGATDMGNAVVTSLDIRPSDNKLLVGTHGSGMWYSMLSGTLPVSLNSFSGIFKNGDIWLEWTTNSEQNSKWFEVEKSYDGRRFHRIGIVAAAGNSQVSKGYRFKDREPAVDIQYYRLRQVDIDDKFEVSSTIQVRNPDAVQSLTVMGNPVEECIRIRFGRIPIGKVGLLLTDVAGNQVFRAVFTEIAEPALDISLPKSLASGYYYLSVYTEGKRFVKSIAKR